MSQNKTSNTVPEKTPWKIWLALIAAACIFILATSVIYYRFITTPPTDCNIFVTGNHSLDGYNVIVERVTGDETKKRTLQDTLNKGNQYQARFFLPSGTYRVEVWDKQPSRIASESEFVPPNSRLVLDLNRKFPAPTESSPAPATSPR